MDEPRRTLIRVAFGELGWADDAREPLRAPEEALLLPSGTLGDGPHRGRNLAPTRLFLMSDEG